MHGNRAQVQIGVRLTAALLLVLAFTTISSSALTDRAASGVGLVPAFRISAVAVPLPPRPKPLPNGGITTQGVRLSARLSEDAPPIGSGVRWSLIAIAGNTPTIEREKKSTSQLNLSRVSIAPAPFSGRSRRKLSSPSPQVKSNASICRSMPARLTLPLTQVLQHKRSNTLSFTCTQNGPQPGKTTQAL